MALYHSAKGSVDYSLYGTPTIVNGIITGGDTSNYVYTNANLPLSTLTSLEIVVKATHPSGTSGFRIASFSGNNYSFLEVTSAGKIEYYGNPTCYRTSLSIDNYDYVKLTLANATAVPHIYFSIDGTNWTESELSTISTEARTIADAPVNFGRSKTSNNGSIDLNETYIKVNGQAWFGICPIEVQKHQLMGPVGYTVVGSPTLVDGILQGSNGTDYVQTSSGISLQTPFELQMRFLKENKGCKLLNFNNFWFSIYSTSTSDDIRMEIPANTLSTGITVSNNVWSILRLVSDGSTLTLSIKPESASEFMSASLPIPENYSAAYQMKFGRYYSTSSTSLGNCKIDLNNTYIKVNGKLWFWQPRETEKIVVNGVEVWTKPQPPESDYTVHGNPTINGTVVSGFSSSNYLTVDKTLPDMSTVTSMELIVQVDGTNGGFNPSGSGSVGGVLCPATTWGHSPCIYFNGDYYLYIMLPDSNHQMQNVIGSGYHFNLIYGKVGYIKLVYGSAVAQQGVFLKGFGQYNDWTAVGGTIATDFSGWDEAFTLGAYTTNTSVSNWFPGSIDLSQCSITFNGTKWWPNNL